MAVVYAFVRDSLVLVKVIDQAWGFCLEPRRRPKAWTAASTARSASIWAWPWNRCPSSRRTSRGRPMRAAQRQATLHRRRRRGRNWRVDARLVGLCQAGAQPPRRVQGRLSLMYHRAGQPLPLPRRRSASRLSDNLQLLFQDRLNGRRFRVHVETRVCPIRSPVDRAATQGCGPLLRPAR